MNPNAFPILHEGDPYRFACTRCGECCFDQIILLEPQDVFAITRLAKVQPSSTALFAAQRITIARIDDEWRCQLVTGPTCSFLTAVQDERDRVRGFACSLHESGAKPQVCASSPLARARGEPHFRLVAPVEACPGLGKGEVLRAPAVNARSLWFHDTLAPLLTSEERVRSVFDFDAQGVLADWTAFDGFLLAARAALSR